MIKQSRLLTYAVSAFLLLLLTAPSWAADGTIQINQSKANAGGVTQGDSPGFPVTISKSGSYRLSGNLTVPDVNTTAVEITSGDVTLDLNGFAIIGPATCVEFICLSGSGKGVSGLSELSNVTVINGVVRGMGSHGVALGAHSRVENIHALNNGRIGIFAGPGSIVTGNTVAQNGSSGIEIHSSTVTGNTVLKNGSNGIEVVTGSCVVIGNTVEQNFGYGLSLNLYSGYGNNSINANNGGDNHPQVSDGRKLGTNVCGGDTTCP